MNGDECCIPFNCGLVVRKGYGIGIDVDADRGVANEGIVDMG